MCDVQQPTTEEQRQVLLDLFQRLPTRDLAYGCRGASLEWQALLDRTAIRQRVERRLDIVEQVLLERPACASIATTAAVSSAQTTTCSTTATATTTASPLHNCYDRFLLLCRPVYLHWHREYILRRFRRAHVERGVALHQLWKQRATGTSADPVSLDRAMAPEGVCRAMYERGCESREALKQRLMIDDRDRLVERQTLALEASQQTMKADQQCGVASDEDDE